MKYSIIIPTLNEEKLLPHLLKQLNAPEFRKKYDVEIIVSDGGSKDSTIALASEGCDIIKLHSGPQKQNIPQGRNAGALSASGDVFVFINADILFDDIIKFFTYLEKHFLNSEYSAMTCSVKVFPEEERVSDRIFHWVYNHYFLILNKMGIGMGRGECQVIKKNVFKEVNGYNEELAAGEDFDLFRRIQKSGKILFANNLYIFESPRRYRKFGYNAVTFMWMKNGLSVFLKNKSINKEWEQVR